MIIAVDFDGTLCEDKFPEIGAAYEIRLKRLNNVAVNLFYGLVEMEPC